MADSYAYVYVDPRDRLPFYVGKGQGRRARKHLCQTSNPALRDRLATLARVGLVPLIGLLPCATSHEALEVEAALIAAFGRLSDGGTLVNVSPGGSNGMGGRHHSPATIERIRTAMKARRLSPEHRARIGAWGRTPEGRAIRSAAATKGNRERVRRG